MATLFSTPTFGSAAVPGDKAERTIIGQDWNRSKNATDVELGLDPTATMEIESTDDDALQAGLTEVNPSAQVTPYIKQAFEEGKTASPLYKLHVYDEKLGERFLLVRNPATSSVSPTGRTTRIFVAFDLHEKAFRILKDSSRPGSDGIYADLAVADDCASTLGYSDSIGTVCDDGNLHMPNGKVQVTRGYGDTGHLWRTHTRTLLNEVGVPLKDYRNSKELCTVVLHALEAHRDAWKSSKIFNRDVSDANIFIYKDSKSANQEKSALLVDWDLSKSDASTVELVQKNRTGIRRFTSAAVLQFPNKPYEVADDLEDLRDVLSYRYDRNIFEDGCWKGGWGKYYAVMNGHLPCDISPTCHRFDSLLSKLARLCEQHYLAAQGSPESSLDEEDSDSGSDSEARIIATRTLDTHESFLDAFRSALRKKGWKDDKVAFDQFSHIPGSRMRS
ncbi:hypothetical protein EIP91_009391 [Steccherinum ochraceum]|uniref:Fungal-type protein kinase domain-containing protein n=1 Tax=Steccherinum ochraceum TaxID=92696 RepID=A0A4R0RB55_9APHY|nr:hypothetical protein EIP91_009391 [Steccherinum ochraceum]